MAVQLQKNPTWLPVVAVLLRRPDGRFLMQKRPVKKHHGGMWEFPGGKVEKGETPAFALVREIEEELGLKLDASQLQPACFAESAAEGGHPPIVILLYTAKAWRGDPIAREGGELAWFDKEEAAKLPKPPLDIALLASLGE